MAFSSSVSWIPPTGRCTWAATRSVSDQGSESRQKKGSLPSAPKLKVITTHQGLYVIGFLSAFVFNDTENCFTFLDFRLK